MFVLGRHFLLQLNVEEHIKETEIHTSPMFLRVEAAKQKRREEVDKRQTGNGKSEFFCKDIHFCPSPR